MQPGTPNLTGVDVVGLASSLSQLTCFRAVVQAPEGPVELGPDELVAALATHDPVLARLVGLWTETGRALREHVIGQVGRVEHADPFRVGSCGHAM